MYFISVTISVMSAGEQLARRKLGLLNFTVAAATAVEDVLEIYLAAAAASDEAVSRCGEELLRKRCASVLPTWSADAQKLGLAA